MNYNEPAQLDDHHFDETAAEGGDRAEAVLIPRRQSSLPTDDNCTSLILTGDL